MFLKNISVLFKIGKWLISIASLAFIFVKLKNTSLEEFEFLFNNIFGISKYWMLIVVFVLMLINWFTEALKWKIILKNLQNLSLVQAYKSVFAGVAFGIVTPNRIGELVGRILYIDEDNKISASLLNFICSTFQLLVTFAFGALGLFFFKENWLQKIPFTSLLSITILVILLTVCIIYFLSKIPNLSNRVNEYFQPFRKIEKTQATTIFVLSVLRYIIFTTQYIIVLYMMGIELSVISCLVCISVNFFLITIIPTYALAEIGVRGTVAVSVFSVYGVTALPVATASIIIWIINLAIPAIFGTFILLKD